MDDYVLIARKAIDKYVKTSRKLMVEDMAGEVQPSVLETLMSEQSGAFVSIHKTGHLRGCIGTIEATSDNLFDEIVYSAISACSSDPRFKPVCLDELIELEVKVDRLYPPQAIGSIDELDVIKYGVIVEQGTKRGLLLPNLEGIDTVEDQVAIALSKAGITDMKGIDLYRFEVERHT